MPEVYNKVLRNNFLFKFWNVCTLGKCLQDQDSNVKDAVNI